MNVFIWILLGLMILLTILILVNSNKLKNRNSSNNSSNKKKIFTPNHYIDSIYKSKHGNIYIFRIVELVKGKYGIDIVHQPDYINRNTNCSVTHRLYGITDTKHSICIATGHSPTSIDAAKKLAIGWAELTDEYIRTGKTLDQQIGD